MGARIRILFPARLYHHTILIYDCNLLEAQRGILRKKVTKKGQWPAD